MTQLVATLIYLGLLLMPGWLLARLLFPEQHRFLFSYSLSLVILSTCLVIASSAGYHPLEWLELVAGVIVLLIGINLYRQFQRRTSRSERQTTLTTLGSKCHALSILLIIFSFSFYHLTVGPYSEIPSDIWIHLARVNDVFLNFDSIASNVCRPVQCVSDQGHLIYLLHASVATLVRVNPIDLITISTLVTGGLFLFSVYFFSVSVFRDRGISIRLCAIGGVLAALLTLILFGTASFSFVRYYSYFPVVFAFPVFFLATLLFIDYLESRPWSTLVCWLSIPVFVLLMQTIHRQEAFFFLLILAVLALVYGAETFGPKRFSLHSSSYHRRRSFFYFTIVGMVLTTYLLLGLERNEWKGTPHVVDAGLYLAWLAGLPLDNPSFRLWDTIGYSGLVVLIWAILRWRILVQSKFLLAGLLIPVLTNLNPFYAALFLRLDMPSTLWRTAYLFPVGIMAAFLIVNTLFRSTRMKSKVPDYLLLICLFVACVPWQIGDTYNRTSRIPSLYPTGETSGAELWKDLIDASLAIQSHIPIKRIITDSTTSFILEASTRGKVQSRSKGIYFPKHNQDYQPDFLESDYSGSLLVINRRDGQITDNARYSGHWPTNTLRVSQKYPADLDNFIETHPRLFERLWSSRDIDIFLMKHGGQ